MIRVYISNAEAVVVEAGQESDTINVTPSSDTSFMVEGGEPIGDGRRRRRIEGIGDGRARRHTFHVHDAIGRLRIVLPRCNHCIHEPMVGAGADTAGVSRIQHQPHFRMIRVMCSGRIQPGFIPRAGEERQIHIWWGGLQNNGDLMLLLAHLLRLNPEWIDARLTVRSIARSQAFIEDMQLLGGES